MNCCANCFKDSELKAMIEGNNIKGTCYFCKSNNEFIFDITKENYIKNYFAQLIDIYIPIRKDMKVNIFPSSSNLIDILKNKWNIFNLKQSQIKEFLIEMFPHRYKSNPAIFDEDVEIVGINDPMTILDYSLLKNYQWEDFVTEIKYKNRFHTEIVNKFILDTFLNATIKEYKAGKKFYRARLWDSEKGYEIKDMGPPPFQKVSGGRANPKGISNLYLSNSELTTLYEIRSNKYDKISVGTFELIKDIEIVDLTMIGKISPFQDNMDLRLLAINYDHLKKIEKEISKPHRIHDSELDYLPTQYICDYINSKKTFSGIQYQSTLYKRGINLAIFNSEEFKCIEVKNIEIDSIEYSYYKN